MFLEQKKGFLFHVGGKPFLFFLVKFNLKMFQNVFLLLIVFAGRHLWTCHLKHATRGMQPRDRSFFIRRVVDSFYEKRESQTAPQDIPERRKCSHRTYMGESGGGKLKNANPQSQVRSTQQRGPAFLRLYPGRFLPDI